MTSTTTGVWSSLVRLTLNGAGSTWRIVWHRHPEGSATWSMRPVVLLALAHVAGATPWACSENV
eukprot:12358194-Alexandrium_andersonii.AAC.1